MVKGKGEIVAAVAANCNLSQEKTTEVINAFLEEISAGLIAGDNVRLVGFGTFRQSLRPAREGINPKTGERISIAPSVSVAFKAGTALKDKLNPARE